MRLKTKLQYCAGNRLKRKHFWLNYEFNPPEITETLKGNVIEQPEVSHKRPLKRSCKASTEGLNFIAKISKATVKTSTCDEAQYCISPKSF